ncbi:hypothetical protein HDU97_009045, partial [Phlyctochytrium planicorne]
GRTRILVTNASGLAIPRSDHLFVVHAGRVIHHGSVDNVIKEIRDEVNEVAVLSSGASSVSSYTLFSNSGNAGGSFKDGLREMMDVVAAERVKFFKEVEEGLIKVEDPLAGEEKKGVLVHDDVAKRLVEEEAVAEGVMGSEVYKVYFNAAGGWRYFILLLLGYSFNHVSTMALDALVYLWCKAYEALENLAIRIAMSSGFVSMDNTLGVMFSHSNNNSKNEVFAAATAAAASGDSAAISRKFIPAYIFMVVMCLAIISCRLLLLFYGSIQAGRNIHRRMMNRLVRAPVKFFEVTPMGRIVNRFTKDMSSVDRAIASSAGNSIYNIVLIGFTIGAIASVVPFVLIAIIPIAWIYWSIGQYFVRTSRSLKRIDSVSRSPIFSHFSETLNGVMVIRAFNDVPRFNSEIHKRIDAYSRINMLFMFAYRWLSIRTQFIGSTILAVATYLILRAGVGRSLTGLCITFAMNLTNLLFDLVLMQGWLDANMNSMERCNEYLKIDQEAPEVIPENRPPQSWPSEGRISIDGLRLKYGPDLPEVLRGMSCEIGAMEKVAVVGRTGAGKSSLALALFRMVEPSGGNIRIDGVDILRIGLEDLRSRLTIIPQDPILFTGTIRTNLDPFGVTPDADLWIALKRSHLITSIPSASGSNPPSPVAAEKKLEPETLKRADGSDATLVIEEDAASNLSLESPDVSITLDTDVAEGGSNLSAGQRQLLCLARAMARKSRVIVMDEATASVDPETDSRIQQTLREEFSDCTVITIAHRLKTIVDYDRVIVLDAGQVVENASPFELIEKGDGVFRKMCEETGEFDDLIVIAKGRHMVAHQRV